MTESLKMKEKKKTHLHFTQSGLHFGLYSSRPFSKNHDFSGSRGQGSQWGDIPVGRGPMRLETHWGALGGDVGY